VDSPSPKATTNFLAWPGWRHLGYTIAVGTGWTLIFYLVYGTASWLTDQHNFRLFCDLPFETKLPMVTAMSVVYLGLFPLMMLSPFIIRERRAYWNYARALTIELLIAAVFFIFLPIKLRFPTPKPEGVFAGVFRFANAINLEHNNVPSLHVAFALTTAVAFFSRTRNNWVRSIIVTGCLAVAASTVLTHQHHIVDAIAGAVLAWQVCRRVFRSEDPMNLSVCSSRRSDSQSAHR